MYHLFFLLIFPANVARSAEACTLIRPIFFLSKEFLILFFISVHKSSFPYCFFFENFQQFFNVEKISWVSSKKRRQLSHIVSLHLSSKTWKFSLVKSLSKSYNKIANCWKNNLYARWKWNRHRGFFLSPINRWKIRLKSP